MHKQREGSIARVAGELTPQARHKFKVMVFILAVMSCALFALSPLQQYSYFHNSQFLDFCRRVLISYNKSHGHYAFFTKKNGMVRVEAYIYDESNKKATPVENEIGLKVRKDIFFSITTKRLDAVLFSPDQRHFDSQYLCKVFDLQPRVYYDFIVRPFDARRYAPYVDYEPSFEQNVVKYVPSASGPVMVKTVKCDG